MTRISNNSYSKLKGRMKEMDVSQSDLAKTVGISVQSLNAKLNGKVEFKVGEAKLICTKLKINNAEKFFFTD